MKRHHPANILLEILFFNWLAFILPSSQKIKNSDNFIFVNIYILDPSGPIARRGLIFVLILFEFGVLLLHVGKQSFGSSTDIAQPFGAGYSTYPTHLHAGFGLKF